MVILHYNQPEMTARCVAYVGKQTYSPLDIVVVDNASTPENYENLCGLLPPDVTLIRNRANLGYAAGNNVGIRPSGILAPAVYTMILNGDVFLSDPDMLAKLIGALCHDPDGWQPPQWSTPVRVRLRRSSRHRYAGHHPIWAFWWRTAGGRACYLS